MTKISTVSLLHGLTSPNLFPIFSPDLHAFLWNPLKDRSPMNKKNIILTGFMGTGKSSLGQLLAQKLHTEFIDTDQLIEERAGKSITAIFQDEGEASFRRQEAALVQELAERQNLVIATGGGLLLKPENVSALQRNGQIFCLVATPEEILDRISQQPGTRPLLANPDPLQKISELLKQRAATYEQFPRISTSGRSPEQLLEILLRKIIPHD